MTSSTPSASPRACPGFGLPAHYGKAIGVMGEIFFLVASSANLAQAVGRSRLRLPRISVPGRGLISIQNDSLTD